MSFEFPRVHAEPLSGLPACVHCCSKMENTMPNTHQPTRHFSKPTSPSSMKTICAGFVPKNTAKATGWAKHVLMNGESNEMRRLMKKSVQWNY